MDRVAPEALSWAPSRAVFLRRVAISGAVTFAVLAVIGLVVARLAGLPMVWLVVAAFGLTLGFMIEDAVRWQAAKYDRWQIDGNLLVHDGPEGRAQIALSEINSVTTTMSGRVLIKLTSGQRMLIRYLPFPFAAAAQIEAARRPITP